MLIPPRSAPWTRRGARTLALPFAFLLALFGAPPGGPSALVVSAHAASPAARGATVPLETIRYTSGGAIERLSPAEVAARVAARPNDRHLVWTPGLATWVPPAELPAVAAALATLPALPPAPFRYTSDGRILELSPEEVAEKVAASPLGTHYVWRRGMPAWAAPTDVPELLALVQARSPAAPEQKAPPPVVPAPAPVAQGPTVAEIPDPAAAIRGHLRSLDHDPRPPPEIPELVRSFTPGEGEDVLYEAPPLPGQETEMEIEVLTPEEAERILKEEGLK